MFNILIVEDDYELRHLFQRVLIQNGYRVRGVEDGKAALEALEKEYADLIISDIMMPVMDGYELVRALRGSGIQTPVLMITVKDAFDDMRKGFLSGTDDYMVKPVNVNEMVLRVGALLRRAQMINDRRLDQGMIDEVQSYLAAGNSPKYLYRLGLEYRYIADYLDGKYSSFEEFYDHLSQAIKRFAKKQMTWFRRDTAIHWLDMEQEYFDQACVLINLFLQSSK